MMKKLVSLLLALVMALGLCSGVWAENTDPVDDQESNQAGRCDSARIL